MVITMKSAMSQTYEDNGRLEEQSNFTLKEQILLDPLPKFTLKEQILLDPLPNFLPQWTAKVLDGEESTQDINYTNSARCLVGEAHGMNNDYRDHNFLKAIIGRDTYCNYCNKMSFKSDQRGMLTAIEAMNDKKKFIEFKKEMFDHMQKHHKKEFKKLWLNR